MKIEPFFKKWALLFFLLILFGCNSSSGGENPPEAKDTENPSRPSSLDHSAIYSNKVSLSWPASTDNVGVSKYRIYRNGSLIAEITSTLTLYTSYIDSSVTDPARYCYSVSALDEAGNESEKSPETCFDGQVLIDAEPPSKPSGLTVSVSKNSAKLEWTASTDNVAVTGYFVYRNGRFIDYTQDTKFTDNDIAENSKYCYSVSARDMRGNESPGTEACLNTSAERIKWYFETSSYVVGNVGVVADGTVFAADENRLYAIDPEGREKWRYTPEEGNEYGSLLISPTGSIYLLTTENLYSINSDGLLKWKKSVRCGSLIAGSENGTVFVSDCDSIYAFTKDGSTIWQKNMPGSLVYGSGKTDMEGNLYLIEPGFLMAIASDGTEKWKAGNLGQAEMLNRQIAVSPDGNIYISSFSPPPGMTETLYSFSKGGTLKFTNSSMGYKPPIAIGADGIVYIGAKSDSLAALNPDGSIIWETKGAYPSAGVPPLSLSVGKNGGLLLVDSNSGYLRTFKPDGAADWIFFTGISRTIASVSADGTIITGSEKAIYALKP
ncbi:PQQ-binding-like beta-propeller repeat protein [Desulforegula conservatrix]|uniref:PQQ-binding-like beta-propeller repeat protein n=1 Tax=Desulforegula conservatrix TaxID=153026 RepID=UPI0003FFA3C0|nr:PQQ-binding-like beta-propeller repeat protein [Desulforegula conservatrix]